MRPKRASLVNLIYVSRLVLAGDVATRARQIGEITKHARKKNEFAVLTSFLIVEGGFAVQVIEGERQAVHDTFQRIGSDDRHRDVQIVEWREIAKRAFVTSLTAVARNPATEARFAEAGLLPMLQRGTPRAGVIRALAEALQGETMARPGIDHLFG